MTNSIGDDFSKEVGIRYLNGKDFSDTNIFGFLQMLINRLPILLLMYYAVKNIYFQNEYVDRILKLLLQYTYVLMYISFLFYDQQASSFLSTRFWDASIFTFVLFSASYFFEKIDDYYIRVSYYLLVLANVYNLSYSLYKI